MHLTMLVCFIPFVCVPTTIYVQLNSLHEMALVPKWSIIYTPPWTFLESAARFSVKVSYSGYTDVVMCASCFHEKGVCTSQYCCIAVHTFLCLLCTVCCFACNGFVAA